MVAVRMSRNRSELAVVRVAPIQAEWPNSASIPATTLQTVPAQAATEANPCTTIVRFNPCRSATRSRSMLVKAARVQAGL
jgi:hypothetical protein